MAYAVTEQEVWIDQALHGYSSGHRLLACSAKLPETDARTMLVLSDAFGGRPGDPDQGYLTGYPLPGASKYVLARTWPAPEMPRPGCVWTHSLLIGFADLATIASADDLLEIFQRPLSSIAGYDRKLSIPRQTTRIATATHPGAGGLLNALYVEPSIKVEMRAGNPGDDEKLLLAVWLQQWPRLRRSFRFCSAIGGDRSTETGQFDVQLVGPLVGPKRTASSAVIIVDGEPRKLDPRLDIALEDLRQPTGLRPFLRKIGSDVPTGRAAMVSLCQLYDALDRAGRHETSYSAALDAFDLLGSEQARAARAIVLERALSDIEDVDDRTFEFIGESMVKDEVILDPESTRRVGRALWRRSPMNFAAALSEEGPLRQAATAATASMDVGTLAEGVVAEPMIANGLVRVRADLLTSPRFWQASLPDVGTMLQLVEVQNEKAVLRAIVASGRADVASSVVRRFGSAQTLMAVSESATVEASWLSEWLDSIARDAPPLGLPLSSGRLTRALVVGLSYRMDPDILPNDFGVDPWLIAARTEGNVGGSEEKRFAAFLMARALGGRSRSSAELLQISFDRVHAALGDGSMPYEGWRLIERFLSWRLPWGEWDKCARVREAVTARFVEHDLTPEVFGRLTDSGFAFREMAEIAAKTGMGRRYLDRVQKAIRKEPESFMHTRAKIIAKLI